MKREASIALWIFAVMLVGGGYLLALQGAYRAGFTAGATMAECVNPVGAPYACDHADEASRSAVWRWFHP